MHSFRFEPFNVFTCIYCALTWATVVANERVTEFASERVSGVVVLGMVAVGEVVDFPLVADSVDVGESGVVVKAGTEAGLQ